MGWAKPSLNINERGRSKALKALFFSLMQITRAEVSINYKKKLLFFIKLNNLYYLHDLFLYI